MFTCGIASSQSIKKLQYGVDAGIGIPVGPNTFSERVSKINPWGVYYLRTERYKAPSFRVRASALYQLGSRVSVGLRSGADVYYLERNADGQVETYVGIPMELIAQVKTIHLNDSRSLFFGGGVGYKTRKKYVSGLTRRGGMMMSAELVSKAISKKRSVYYKAGFEYAEENTRVGFNPPPNLAPYLTKETIDVVTARHLVFVSIGYQF